MNPESVTLILGLVSRGVGVAAEIAALARRVTAGETITDADIDAVQDAYKQTVAAWDAEADKDT